MDKLMVRALKSVIEYFGGAVVVLNGPKGQSKGDVKPIPAALARRLEGEGRVAFADDALADDKAGMEPGQAGEALAFTMKYRPVGKWALSGPGIPEGTVIEAGKEEAQARLDSLRADYEARMAAGDPDGETGQAGEAPV